MKDCVFCKIVNGELPCYKIYEDDFVLAFLDIANDIEGHTVVTSKKHYENVCTCDNTTLNRLIEACKKIGKHYVEDCGFDGFNILNNMGQCAGQSVMHVHFHVYPRRKNDGKWVAPNNPGCDKELEQIWKEIKFEEKEQPKLDDENAVVLYTDGACSGNPGAGGWAAILSYKGKEKVLSGGEENTTNNRMELMAVISGLEAVKKAEKVEVFSDSAYVVNAFNQNWLVSWQANNWKTSGKGEVLNKDLWQRLLAATEKFDVEFHKVKGHSDNAYNNRCDALAREEISKLKKD